MPRQAAGASEHISHFIPVLVSYSKFSIPRAYARLLSHTKDMNVYLYMLCPSFLFIVLNEGMNELLIDQLLFYLFLFL